MNKQEIQSKIEELEKQLDKLKEELNKPENKVFKPKIDDRYYIITDDGRISQYTWNNDNFDNMHYAISNCFKTKEKAEFEVEKLKVIAELKRFAEEHNEPIDWKDEEQPKWYICDIFGPAISSIKYINNNDIYFSSKELAKQAIKTIGEDRIKKYYLGVEE